MNLPIFKGIKETQGGEEVVGDLIRQKTFDINTYKISIGYYIKTDTNKITNNGYQIVKIKNDTLEVSLDNGNTFQRVKI